MDKPKSMLDFRDRHSYVEYLQEQCYQLHREGHQRSAEINQTIITALRDYEMVFASIPTVALLALLQVELVFGRTNMTCDEHAVIEHTADSTRDAIEFASYQHIYREHVPEMVKITGLEDEPWENILDLMPPEMRRMMRLMRQRDEVKRG